MKNEIPKSLDRLFALAESIAQGLEIHEGAIGIMHNPQPVLRSNLKAALAAETQFQALRAVKINATTAQGAAADEAVKFIVKTRDVLKSFLGTRWSQSWTQVGFVGGSLSVPNSVPELVGLVQRMQIYLITHPTQQNALLNMTPAVAAQCFTALSAANNTVNTCLAETEAKRKNRDQTVETLRKRMRGLITELGQLIGEDDARWRAFGLRTPSGSEVAEVPAGLSVVAGRSGHLTATWQPSARADRYHVYQQVLGVDSDFARVITVSDRDADLNTFASGAKVLVRVTAVNEAGESSPSEEFEQVVA